MNKAFINILLSFLLTLAASQGLAQEELTILFLGDSLTEGYGLDEEESFPSLVKEMLAADGINIRVLNAGISGSTSASALSRLQWYIRSQPDLMVLSLGANDGLRGLSIDEMKANLAETIEFAQANGVQAAITGMMVPPNMGPEYTDAFARVFPDLATEYDIPLMPFLLQDVAAVPELNQADGIHPNAEGTRIVATNMVSFLKTILSSG
ncbi:MAG: arylesterase [Gammaproteobacteria bacterium]|nr:arylesterase [Gammaproteobacteria bacterium]